MNKRAEDQVITEELIFFLLNIVFFVLLLLFVIRNSSGDAVTEERYAKAIALAVDNMQPGTEIRISINYLNERLKNNKLPGVPLFFDQEKNIVTVKISKNGGYGFNYYSNVKEIIIENKDVLVIKT